MIVYLLLVMDRTWQLYCSPCEGFPVLSVPERMGFVPEFPQMTKRN